MNVTCSIGTLFEISLNYDTWKPKNVKFRQGVLNENNTYWLIFNKESLTNKPAFDYLLTFPGIKIVYQSEPAVNGNSGYGRAVRNFLLVFEYEKPVQPLPEVSGQGE